MSWGRVHHKTCRFIEYEKRFIFMKDVKGNAAGTFAAKALRLAINSPKVSTTCPG